MSVVYLIPYFFYGVFRAFSLKTSACCGQKNDTIRAVTVNQNSKVAGRKAKQ